MGLNHQPSWPLHGPVLHLVFEAGGCTDGPTSHLSPLDEQLVLELEGGGSAPGNSPSLPRLLMQQVHPSSAAGLGACPLPVLLV